VESLSPKEMAIEIEEATIPMDRRRVTNKIVAVSKIVVNVAQVQTMHFIGASVFQHSTAAGNT